MYGGWWGPPVDNVNREPETHNTLLFLSKEPRFLFRENILSDSTGRVLSIFRRIGKVGHRRRKRSECFYSSFFVFQKKMNPWNLCVLYTAMKDTIIIIITATTKGRHMKAYLPCISRRCDFCFFFLRSYWEHGNEGKCFPLPLTIGNPLLCDDDDFVVFMTLDVSAALLFALPAAQRKNM